MACSTILVIVILYQRYWADTALIVSQNNVDSGRLSNINNMERQGGMVAPRLKHSVQLNDLELE